MKNEYLHRYTFTIYLLSIYNYMLFLCSAKHRNMPTHIIMLYGHMPTPIFSLSSFYDFWMKPNPLPRPAPGQSALAAVCANLAKEFVLFCFNVK